jgi:quercetin dioxygenase-like cupin family protein
MNKILAAASAALISPGSVAAQDIDVSKADKRTQTKGSAQFFTGGTMVDALFPADNGRHANGGHVTFEPGARTKWHTHPAGQTLIVTEGSGWIVQWNGEHREIKTGDVVWIPPSVKHWHGASTDTSMRHIALQESIDGKNVDWLEEVSDEQYRK